MVMTKENNNPSYKEILKMGKGEKFLILFFATTYSISVIYRLHKYLKDRDNFSNLKNLKDFKINTKYDVNDITEIAGSVLDLLHYVGENIQYYVEPEKVETMKANLEHMDEIFKYTEKDLKVLNIGSKEIKCTKNDVIKFIKYSKNIEVSVRNFQYNDLTKVIGEYMKEYDKKKLKNEEDKVFIDLLKKVKRYFSKLSTGLTECAKISRIIERELKKIEGSK